MPKTAKKQKAMSRHQLRKCPTGIKGLDELTEGGLPKDRIQTS